MVGVLESRERERRPPLFFHRLNICDRPYDFRGQAVAAGHLTGDHSLFHGMRGFESPEENEQVRQRQQDEYQEEQAPADDDAGVELGLRFAHAG